MVLEAQPELFVEMSPQLAGELGIKNGDRVKVESIRGEVDALPWSRSTETIQGCRQGAASWPYVAFGWLMPSRTRTTQPTSSLREWAMANTMCPEYKGFMVNVRKYEGGVNNV